MNISAHIYIEIYDGDGLADDSYDTIQDICIDNGNNHSEIEVLDNYTIRVYFDTQEHCANAEAVLNALTNQPTP